MFDTNQAQKKTIDSEKNYLSLVSGNNSNNMARSQSLKPDMKDRYKNWLNQSNVSISLK